MLKRLLIVTFLFLAGQNLFAFHVEFDTLALVKKAKLLTLSAYGTDVSEHLNALTVKFDTTNKSGSSSYLKNPFTSAILLMEIMDTLRDCSFILAYDMHRPGGGRFYRLKGFNIYEPSEIKEIYSKLNFKTTPKESLVNQLTHLKYCKSRILLRIFRKKIPKSCYVNHRIIRAY